MGSVAMRLSLALMCLLAVSPAGASIDSPRVPRTDAPPVDSLVAAALARSPSLAEMRARVQGARERVRAAGALPNPMLEVMLQDVGFPSYTVGDEDMSMIGPQLTQSIPFPGKRGARRRAAAAGVAVRERQLDAARREIARDVRVLAARLYALDAEDALLDTSYSVLTSLSSSANDRYSSGGANSGPVIEARLAILANDERRNDLLAERRGVTAALARLTNDDARSGMGRLRALPEFGEDNGFHAADTPEMAVRAAETRAADAELGAARAERLPDLVAGAGVGFRGNRDKVVTLRLGLDLPLWGGSEKRALARAAEQDVIAARAAEEAARVAGGSELSRVIAEGVRNRSQVVRYREEIVPARRLAFEMARSAYMVGRGELSAVLVSFGAWLDARVTLARRQAEGYANWAEIARIQGEEATEANAGGRK